MAIVVLVVVGYDEWLEFKPSSSCHCKQYIIKERTQAKPNAIEDFLGFSLFTRLKKGQFRPKAVLLK
jgi:hypothetical protein